MTSEQATASRCDAPTGAVDAGAGHACAPRPAESESAALPAAEQRATLAFFSVEGIGPVTLGALREVFGSLREALQAPLAELLPVLRDDSTRGRVRAAGDLGAIADRCLERAERLGARLLFPGAAGWPRQLQGVDFPPLLYVLGRLAPDAPRVGIVGSRGSDAYGDELAAFFSSSLARGGAGIVSGGALGVDAAAHRAALGAGGATVAVLGTGVDVVYPGEHRALFEEIVAGGGALVSHLPPGTPGVRQNFKVRNRVIAALAEAVIVARAGEASGALGTAVAGRALGRPVFAIPGDVTCPLSAGVNALIERGEARLLTSVGPVAAALSLPDGDWPSAAPVGSSPASRSKARSRPAPPPSRVAAPAGNRTPAREVPEELRPVYQALGNEPIQFDELASLTGLDAAGLAAALLRLELMDLCEERAGKVFRRR